MFVTWKRNVLFETAVLFVERWRYLTYSSNEPNFINNALLVAKEYFHFKLSNVTKRAAVACAQCASRTEVLACAHGASVRRTAVLACSQCASRTEAPSNGLWKYHMRERTDPHSHVDLLNLIIYIGPIYIYCIYIYVDKYIYIYIIYIYIMVLYRTVYGITLI